MYDRYEDKTTTERIALQFIRSPFFILILIISSILSGLCGLMSIFYCTDTYFCVNKQCTYNFMLPVMKQDEEGKEVIRKIPITTDCTNYPFLNTYTINRSNRYIAPYFLTNKQGVLRGSNDEIFIKKEEEKDSLYGFTSPYGIVPTAHTDAAGKFWLDGNNFNGHRFFLNAIGMGTIGIFASFVFIWAYKIRKLYLGSIDTCMASTFIIILFAGTIVNSLLYFYCEHKRSTVEEIYTRAIYEIPIDFNKDEIIAETTIGEKEYLVNIFLIKSIQKHNKPLMYDIDNKEYIPYDSSMLYKVIKNSNNIGYEKSLRDRGIDISIFDRPQEK